MKEPLIRTVKYMFVCTRTLIERRQKREVGLAITVPSGCLYLYQGINVSGCLHLCMFASRYQLEQVSPSIYVCIKASTLAAVTIYVCSYQNINFSVCHHLCMFYSRYQRERLSPYVRVSYSAPT